MKKYMIVTVLILLFALIGRVYVNGLFEENDVQVVIENISVCTILEEERCVEKVIQVTQDIETIYLDVKYTGEEISTVTWYYTLNDSVDVIAQSTSNELNNHHTFSLEKNLDTGWLIGEYEAVIELGGRDVQSYVFEVVR